MSKFTLGSLGDSISTGFNAEVAGDNLHHSWTASHRQRVAGLFPTLVVGHVNVAFNGARAADLNGQVDRLLPVAPDYVTCLIGANDLPRWLLGDYRALLAQFGHDVRTAVARLVAANPRVLILLAAVPDQSRVVHLFAPQLGFVAKTYKERWEKANQILATIAADFPANGRFVTATAAAAFNGEHLSPLDSYHPSIKGQRLIADLTWGQGFFPV